MPSIELELDARQVAVLDAHDGVVAGARRTPRRSARRPRPRRPRSPPRARSARARAPARPARRAGARRPGRRRARCRAAARPGRRPAATLRRPWRTIACASSVAVVVPSPATSLVSLATSLHQPRALALEQRLELDLARDRHAVVGDDDVAGAEREHHVAALGAERDLDGVGDGVDAGQQRGARLGVVAQVLGSHPIGTLISAVSSSNSDVRTVTVTVQVPARLNGAPERDVVAAAEVLDRGRRARRCHAPGGSSPPAPPWPASEAPPVRVAHEQIDVVRADAAGVDRVAQQHRADHDAPGRRAAGGCAARRAARGRVTGLARRARRRRARR